MQVAAVRASGIEFGVIKVMRHDRFCMGEVVFLNAHTRAGRKMRQN